MIVAGDIIMKELREPPRRPLTTASNLFVLDETAVVSPVPTSPEPVGAARKRHIEHAGLDQPFHQAIARMSGGLSPPALSQAYTDWRQHYCSLRTNNSNFSKDWERAGSSSFHIAAAAALIRIVRPA
jgi:DNA-binding FadR family transcriptional regulator